MFDNLVNQLAEKMLAKSLWLTTAESCTGGWIAEVITSIPGSSQWFERGFVTYSNASKEEMLGVKPETLKQEGAVSQQTAREMALGALSHSHAHLSVSVTGIAGPDGGSAEKPVGTVWFGFANDKMNVDTLCQHFSGDRQSIRSQAVEFALKGLLLQLVN